MVSANCKDVDSVGCCDGAGLYYCESNDAEHDGCPAGKTTCLCKFDCSTYVDDYGDPMPFCTWYDEAQFFICGPEVMETPADVADSCSWTPCTPNCTGKKCGDDGCGGTCGTCPEGQVCGDDGQCAQGSCSGLCGTEIMAAAGCFCDATCAQYGDCCDDVCDTCPELNLPQCCVPQCLGKVCGPDGCGGFCQPKGECAANETCNPDGTACVTAPTCTDADCPAPWQVCAHGECTNPISQDTICPYGGYLVEGECGATDAVGCCGGDDLYYCETNDDVHTGCPEGLDSCLCWLPCGSGQKTCGWDADNGWMNCLDEAIEPPSGTPLTCDWFECTPSCTGKVCGPDGCGGFCGTCTGSKECSAEGQCVGVKAPIIITEFMADPDKVADTAGEWFEVHNTGSQPVDMNGWTLKDKDGETHTIANGGPLNIPAGGYAVFAVNSDKTKNGGIPKVTYVFKSFTLANTEDEIILENQGTLIDEVRYTAAFPGASGKAAALAPEVDSGVYNDLPENWCVAGTAFGSGDKGTPGAANPSCGFVPVGSSAYMAENDCAEGTQMMLSADGTDVLCLPVQEAQKACGWGDGVCAEGLDCVWTSDKYEQGICLAPAATGEDCGGFAQPLCETGLFCNWTDADYTARQCTAPEASGAPCGLPGLGLCPDGEDCIWNSSSKLAATCLTKAQEGDPCGDFGQPLCEDGLTCNWTDEYQFDRACYPVALEGETCMLPGFGDCLEGLDCVWLDEQQTDAACTAPLAEGDRCDLTGSGLCGEGLGCSWTDASMTEAVCMGPEVLGSLCMVPGYGTCATWTACIWDDDSEESAHCQPLLLAGDECGYGLGLCISEFACVLDSYDYGATSHCLPLRQSGQDCGYGIGECAAGVYCDQYAGTCEFDECYYDGSYGDGDCDANCPLADPDC
jgi:hypothetical protein